MDKITCGGRFDPLTPDMEWGIEVRCKKGRSEITFANCDIGDVHYCGKRLYFSAGSKNSWHRHLVKDETFFLHSGLVLVRYSEYKGGRESRIEIASEHLLLPFCSFHVSPGICHQIEAIENSVIYEASTPHNEDDVVRLIVEA